MPLQLSKNKTYAPRNKKLTSVLKDLSVYQTQTFIKGWVLLRTVRCNIISDASNSVRAEIWNLKMPPFTGWDGGVAEGWILCLHIPLQLFSLWFHIFTFRVQTVKLCVMYDLCQFAKMKKRKEINLVCLGTHGVQYVCRHIAFLIALTRAALWPCIIIFLLHFLHNNNYRINIVSLHAGGGPSWWLLWFNT